MNPIIDVMLDKDDDRPVGNRWFGPWSSIIGPELRPPFCEDDRLRIPTPVGFKCYLCVHEIDAEDCGMEMPYWDGRQAQTLYQHQECGLRTVLGCSAALRGEPHDHEGDYREDALKVVAWVNEHGV